jgi:hypothetical protein
LKRDRQQSNSVGMTGRLIRLLAAISVGTALIGAPAVRAAMAMPCETVVTSAPDHLLSSRQTPAPAPAPCKGAMSGCADMLGCAITAGLPARITAMAHKLIWTSIIYQMVADWHEGLSIKPYLDPPITI